MVSFDIYFLKTKLYQFNFLFSNSKYIFPVNSKNKSTLQKSLEYHIFAHDDIFFKNTVDPLKSTQLGNRSCAEIRFLVIALCTFLKQ